MDYSAILNLALSVVQMILDRFPSKAGAETSEQLADAQAALATLKKFQGSPVTKAQLESLRG